MLLGQVIVVVGQTCTEAEAVPPDPPLVKVTFPLTLFCVPAAVLLTFTAKVQDVLGANVAPDKLIEFVPATAVIVPPPQLPLVHLGWK